MKTDRFALSDSIFNTINLTVLLQGYARVTSPHWRYERIASPFNRLYIVRDGAGEIRNDKHSFRLKESHAYLIPINAEYSYATASFLEKYYLHFALEVLPGQDVFRNSHACLELPLGDVHVVTELVTKGQGAKVQDVIDYKGQLLRIIARFVQFDGNALLRENLLAGRYRPVFDYIEHNCTHGMSLQRLADVVDLPLSSLAASFRRDMGITIREYVHRRLVQMAKVKLHTADRIKTAARELGFEDEFYFSRFFKKHVGLSPKKYLEQNVMAYE